MQSAVIVAVYALAVARITRLIVADKVLERPRRAVILSAWLRAYPWVRAEEPDDPTQQRKNLAMVMANHADNPPMLAYLVVCPWCVSIWVGAVMAPLALAWGTRWWMLAPALALAFSHITGFLATKER